jgi:hypothetical protein
MAVSTPVSVQQAIVDIDAYIRKQGGAYPAWYCGVASDPRDRLFHDHNVSEQHGAWIYVRLATDGQARQVEQHFLRKGCDGGPGGGDHTSRHVYAYKKTSGTNP